MIEKTGRGERAYDIYSRLLQDRIVFLGGGIDDDTANVIIAQMLFLSNEDSSRRSTSTSTRRAGRSRPAWPSTTPCSSSAARSHTYCIGMAASMGAVLMCGGTKGQAVRPAQLAAAAAPAADRRRARRPRDGPVHRGPGNHPAPRAALPDPRQAHGQQAAKIERDCDRNQWLDAEEASVRPRRPDPDAGSRDRPQQQQGLTTGAGRTVEVQGSKQGWEEKRWIVEAWKR